MRTEGSGLSGGTGNCSAAKILMHINTACACKEKTTDLSRWRGEKKTGKFTYHPRLESRSHRKESKKGLA